MFTIIKGGKKPIIKTEFSSSADLCARIDVTLRPGETKAIPLGVIIDLEAVKQSYFNEVTNERIDLGLPALTKDVFEKLWIKFQKANCFLLKIRSSPSFELIIANGEGEIDMDYPKEIGIILHNPLRLKENANEIDFDRTVDIKAGTPIAQIKLTPHHNYLMGDEYRLNKKRVGGYGSTNQNQDKNINMENFKSTEDTINEEEIKKELSEIWNFIEANFDRKIEKVVVIECAAEFHFSYKLNDSQIERLQDHFNLISEIETCDDYTIINLDI